MKLFYDAKENLLNNKKLIGRRFKKQLKYESNVNDFKYTGANQFKELCEELINADFSKIEENVRKIIDIAMIHDNSDANAYLGLFSEEILEDFEQAKYWYNRAAAFGNGIGMYRVGLLYLFNKVEKGPQVSLVRCFTDALDNGIDKAKEILDKYFPNESHVKKIYKRNDDTIYALFLYYGTAMSNNYLCLRVGTCKEVLKWLLNEGYLSYMYNMISFMGTPNDKSKAKKIAKLLNNDNPTKKDINNIDIKIPSCCTCLAVADNQDGITDMVDIINKYKNNNLVNFASNDLEKIITMILNSYNDEKIYDELYRHLSNNNNRYL